MPVRESEAVWRGDLKTGQGRVKLGSGAFEGGYSFSTRFGEEPGTNPEELIAAAHAGCFSMALAGELTVAGFRPESIHTVARIRVDQTDSGFAIPWARLECEARVPNIDEETFLKHANAAKKGCPVSKALAAIEITLDAKLVQ